jgi:hypothetical protein
MQIIIILLKVDEHRQTVTAYFRSSFNWVPKGKSKPQSQPK